MTVRPVLPAAADAWTECGAPRAGYLALRGVARRLERDPGELGLIRAVQQLAEQGWLDVDERHRATDPRLRQRGCRVDKLGG